MARIRSFKPEAPQHRKVGRLSICARWLWFVMVTQADDDGRLVADPGQFRLLAFGYDRAVKDQSVQAWLEEIAATGLLRLYSVAGVQYADFPSWDEHQRISHKTPSKLPPYQDSGELRKIPEDSGLARARGSDRIRSDRNGSEWKGEEGTSPVVLSDDQFLAHLKASPAYKAIDIDRELAKMDAWLLTPKGRRRRKTRQFIVNWLNNADQPLVGAESVSARTAANLEALRRAGERLKGAP
jgi:hypothetical protein